MYGFEVEAAAVFRRSTLTEMYELTEDLQPLGSASELRVLDVLSDGIRITEADG